MVDPANRSGAFESFAYKQIFFEPLLGGGLITAISPVLIAQWGLPTFLVIMAVVLLFWFMAGFLLIRQQRRRAPIV
ncbi:MAG: hypothetical protein IGS54_05270 [Elainella sp. C42_A2020_010]|nr:hypothetical protein [Elainella sp. C42_A2020_010]RNJ68542.1 MAG: hypothetical protein EDM05_15740 [Leptolyngbya sp. IPPAS B-1204]